MQDPAEAGSGFGEIPKPTVIVWMGEDGYSSVVA